MPRTGLIIEVPAADEVVGDWRTELDPRASQGVPAHVTLLFPFAPADRVQDRSAELGALFAGVDAFDFRLESTGWFEPGVLWLAPEPAARFTDLTALLSARFPAYPPYQGAYEDPVPHLTVGDGAAIDRLRAAERDIAPRLPIAASARSVRLMVEQSGGSWRRGVEFPLGSARRP